MKSGTKILIVVAVIAVILIGSVVGTYNGLVTKQENIDNKLADISVQLERRTDLIPNLINTVKGYTKHEEKIINEITTARENLVGAKTVEEKAAANDKLTSALNGLTVIVENYPDLKSNQNFIQLQDELAGTENRIATARRDYNEAVKEYNKDIKKFPNSIIAGMFNFEKAAYFEAKESAKSVPEVSFE